MTMQNLEDFFRKMVDAVQSQRQDDFAALFQLPAVIYKQNGLEIPQSSQDLWDSAQAFWKESQRLGVTSTTFWVRSALEIAPDRSCATVTFQDLGPDGKPVRDITTTFYLHSSGNALRVEMFESAEETVT